MDHLTNVYKHKCEQLQEQLNHLTKKLNEENIIARLAREAAERLAKELAERAAREAAERAAREAAERLAREAAERLAREAAELATRERIAEMFRRLPPNADEWMMAYNYLTETEKAIFNTMYGAIGDGIDGVMRVGVAGGSVFVRIIREPNGVSGIYYWNATTMNWVRFENGYYVRGVGANMGSGIKYSKQWISSIDPSSGNVFSPAPGRPHNFNKTPDITPGSGDVQGGGAGGGGGGLGNVTGNQG